MGVVAQSAAVPLQISVLSFKFAVPLYPFSESHHRKKKHKIDGMTNENTFELTVTARVAINFFPVIYWEAEKA